LLDELRSQRIKVTAALSDLLLRSIDIMREMLRSQQALAPIDQQRVADLQFDLELAVAQKTDVVGPPALAAQPAPTPERTPGTSYRISFRPYLHMLARGNDPLRMFRELRELGDLRVAANIAALPSFEELDPENCYLSWNLELNTDAPRQSVIEVFDWAEGDCELEVIAVEPDPGTATALETAAVSLPGEQPAASAHALIEHSDGPQRQGCGVGQKQ
jgi:two-component system chemotaxis sensor kinase CheA